MTAVLIISHLFDKDLRHKRVKFTLDLEENYKKRFVIRKKKFRLKHEQK